MTPVLDFHSLFKTRKVTRRGLQTLAHAGFVKGPLANACNRQGVALFICGEAYGSKTCQGCGSINENLGSSKTFTCKCGYKEERDIHGASNEFNKLAAGVMWKQFQEVHKRAGPREQQ